MNRRNSFALPDETQGNLSDQQSCKRSSSRAMMQGGPISSGRWNLERRHTTDCLIQSTDSLSLSPVVPHGPMPSSLARFTYSSLLTWYEREEIMKIKEIYYLGVPTSKIHPTSDSNKNFGFDNASYYYRANIGDHIKYRYEIRLKLGGGSFGQVFCCFDHKTQRFVAMKIIVNTPETNIQGETEMEVLSLLNKLDIQSKCNIVKLQESFVFRGHICGVYEVLGPNLYEFNLKHLFEPISMSTIRHISRQVFEALAFIHSHGFVHCDIKPENIVLVRNANEDIRIIDFGSCCRIGHNIYSYIQSRYYRAPEVLLRLNYGPEVDIWSLGCVVAELIMGYPLFAGSNEEDQLKLQMEVLGNPPSSLIRKSLAEPESFENDLFTRFNLKCKSLARVIGIDDIDLLDLIEKCLEWDPDKRITATEALKHRFFKRTEEIPTVETE